MNIDPAANTPATQTDAVAMPMRSESEAAAKARIVVNCLLKGYSEEEACFAAELYADRHFY